MKKINLKDKKKWEEFLKNNDNKLLIVIICASTIYASIGRLIPNFYMGFLIYYLMYLGLQKLYDLIIKHFFASRCK